jgi:hypothetical protein
MYHQNPPGCRSFAAVGSYRNRLLVRSLRPSRKKAILHLWTKGRRVGRSSVPMETINP